MKKSILLVLVTLGVLLSAGPAQALLFQYNYLFSGTAPAGTAPWLTAEFVQRGANTVRLTLNTPGLLPGEFVDGQSTGMGWFFNFNPDKIVTNLAFTFVDGNDADAIGTLANGYRADGDGYYDFNLRWNPTARSRLNAGQNAVYDIYYNGGLSESDFNFSSAPGPGGSSGPFLSAAHVQGIAPDSTMSGWIAPGAAPVPEPATMLLLGSGLVGLAGFGRKKLFKRA